MNTQKECNENEGKNQGNTAEAKENQRLPANHQNLGERQNDSPSLPSEGTNHAEVPKLLANTFLLLKLLS
jgi:hypothetical protein